VEKGYRKFEAFYRENYLKHFPGDRNSNILVISCGPGYCVATLNNAGYTNVTGIDSRQSQIDWATRRKLNCEVARAFEFLQTAADKSFDAIFCEQELNHLTKPEIMQFLPLCMQKLKPGGKFICHGLNGANPVVGSEALAQNFDHYNTFTEYTLNQILEHTGFGDINVFPLNLYVFWKNPANYILLLASTLLHWSFRALFIMYGKENKLFTKKIGAVCRKV
jgi:2-polyprenyl-3-methyl-5-hydroxy-6-metoxy-1,4-benzoquinol methylase